MGYETYVAATNLLAQIGPPLQILTAVTAAATLFAALLTLHRQKYRNIALTFQATTLVLLTASFLLVLALHGAIASLTVSFTEGESLRFLVAPWTEGEKPLFWSLLLGAASLYTWRQNDSTEVPALATTFFAALVLLTVAYSPPFPQPIPTLQNSLETWFASGKQTPALYGQLKGLHAYYGSTYMWIHPPTLFGSYTALVVTLAGSILLINGNLKGWEATYPYAAIGYLSLSAGLLLGYPWAVEAWTDTAWWWDPKVGGSILTWTLYTAYLHLGLYRQKYIRTTGFIGVLCFLSLVFTYLLTYFVEGVHTVA